MAQRVGIVAVAQTKYHPNRADANEGELAYEAIRQVLQETGLGFSDDGDGISSAVTCSQDFWDGRTISNLNVMSYVGAHLSHEDKVAEDGVNAVYTAMAQVLSGKHDIVLTVAHMKESQGDKSIIENAAFDPIFLRVLGLDFLTAAALQAQRYMHRYGITAEQCAKVAVKNRGNAKRNPYAQEPMDITVEDVLKSKMLASPIRQLDAKPVSDGACAMILASEEKAKKLTAKPVWILGVSNCYETHYLGDRDLADCNALVKAARKAYGMAGVSDPLKELDLAEVSEEYSYQELLWMEGLGLCGRGEGGKLIDSGVTQMGGQLPVNPSGGMLAGNPNGVAGMARVAECVLQLRNEAGDRQVPGARLALAHGVTGICGQLQAVMILGTS
ncbi:MAG: thiolase family protein [Chloroflexi bacterium]|nr:MAG: thiolase family protein [Chloroflexota bacterium]RLC94864.1 MAG: thiolase family protein [Chloroflexota bacterium]